MSYLLDTNVPIRLIDTGAAQHNQARQAVATLLRRNEEVFITAQNLVELWAVMTRPTERNGLNLSVAEAYHEVIALRAQFPLLEDAPAVLDKWLHLVSTIPIVSLHVHDARLVAIMQTYGVSHILTFDKDHFKKYPGISAVHPSEV